MKEIRYADTPGNQKMNDSRYQLEMLLTKKCIELEDKAIESDNKYRCTCPLPENLTDEEVEKLIKELENE